jgi:hypothetical protein
MAVVLEGRAAWTGGIATSGESSETESRSISISHGRKGDAYLNRPEARKSKEAPFAWLRVDPNLLPRRRIFQTKQLSSKRAISPLVQPKLGVFLSFPLRLLPRAFASSFPIHFSQLFTPAKPNRPDHSKLTLRSREVEDGSVLPEHVDLLDALDGGDVELLEGGLELVVVRLGRGDGLLDDLSTRGSLSS